MLREAFELRQLAEYAETFVLTHDEAEAVLADAEQFGEHIAGILP